MARLVFTHFRLLITEFAVGLYSTSKAVTPASAHLQNKIFRLRIEGSWIPLVTCSPLTVSNYLTERHPKKIVNSNITQENTHTNTRQPHPRMHYRYMTVPLSHKLSTNNSSVQEQCSSHKT